MQGDVLERLRGSEAGFNEAAGADPADAAVRQSGVSSTGNRFNEAAGADPADAR